MSGCEGPYLGLWFSVLRANSRCTASYGFHQHLKPGRYQLAITSKLLNPSKAGRTGCGLHDSQLPKSGVLKVMQLCVKYQWHPELCQAPAVTSGMLMVAVKSAKPSCRCLLVSWLLCDRHF